MKKEYIIVAALALFILGHVFDYLAGPLNLALTNPFNFLNQTIISIYPFTALSVVLKAIVIILTLLTLLSFIGQKQLAKGIFLVFLTAVFELYSIQQLATGNAMIPLPWSLALAFSGVVLLIPAIIYIIIGIIRLMHRQFTKNLYGESKDDGKSPNV